MPNTSLTSGLVDRVIRLLLRELSSLLATHFQLHFNLPLAEVRGGSPEDAVIDGEIDRQQIGQKLKVCCWKFTNKVIKRGC